MSTIRSFWSRQSFNRKVWGVVGAIVVLVLVGGSLVGDEEQMPTSTTAVDVTTVVSAPSTTIPSSTTASSTTTTTKPLTTSTTEPPTTTTAAPTTTGAPTTTEAPSPEVAGLALEIVSVSSPVRPGVNATLRAETAPGAICDITVVYKSGPSEAKGLVTKEADGSGQVSWTWKVGTRTTPGEWPIYVSASLGNQTAAASTSFTVAR